MKWGLISGDKMREFLKIIEKDFGIVRIDKEVSSVFEAAKILREHPKEASNT